MNNLNILFWLRKNSPNSQGQAPIYCRIKYDGLRVDFSIGEYIDPDKWQNQRVTGSKNDAKFINDRIDTIKNKLKIAHNKLEEKDELITAAIIKDYFDGKVGHKNHTLIKALTVAIAEMNELVKNKQMKSTTVANYTYTMNNVQVFIKHQYKKEDIFLNDLITRGKPEYSFAADFEHWGKTIETLKDPKDKRGKKIKKPIWSHNYCKKALSRLSSMITVAYRKGWIERNPFEGLNLKTKIGKPKYLTTEQVQLIKETDIKSESIERIRDVFLFGCYTGMSYAELKKLSKDHFSYGIDGRDWIFITRKKTEDSTGKVCKIPIVEGAAEIIEKYKHDPECISNGVSLPVASNSCYNIYLKILQSACNEYSNQKGLNIKIIENLTTHIARHTCVTVLLDMGYTKDFIAEVLGHETTKLIAKIYGEITTKRMSMEMNQVENRLKAG